MGDVIHSLPALTDAQRAIPNLQVDWVVEPAFAEIPKWHSAVRKVIPFALRQWRKAPFSLQTRQQWQAFKAELQAKRYDAVIDAQGLLKSALFATRLAQGTKYGYDRHSIREPLASLFYDKTYGINYQQHAVERIRQLFAQTLGYALPKMIGDYGIAENIAQFAKKSENSTTCTPYILAIHATTRADKHWSEQAWSALFTMLEAKGLEIHLPWGNPIERERAERLAQHSAHIKVLPKLTLTELAVEILQAQAVVSVDTGLSHLTASLDKPNVILYGATDPNLIGGYGKAQEYVVAKGMENILPQHVFERLTAISP